MGEKCAVCGMNCGIGSIKTNNGENICSICLEKCGGKKNPKIKELSIPELKDIVREYNKKALEARNVPIQNENIVHAETVEPKINTAETVNPNTVNNNNLNTKIPMSTSRKGCGCLNLIIIIISLSVIFNVWGNLSKEDYNTMPIEKAVTKIIESEDREILTYDNDDGRIIIYVQATDYASKRSLMYDTKQIMEKLKGRNDYTEFKINWKMNLFDKKGNPVPSVVMAVTISRDTINTINYDNFITDNIPDLAIQFSTHPAIEK